LDVVTFFATGFNFFSVISISSNDSGLRYRFTSYSTNNFKLVLRLLIRHIINIKFVIPGLTRNSAVIIIGAPCAPLDTGLRRYDDATFYTPDQYQSHAYPA